MAKTAGTKLRILHIYELLRTKSSEEHPLSAPDIVEELAKLDIPCERKAVYSDIDTLIEFGYEIEQKKNAGYYLKRQ